MTGMPDDNLVAIAREVAPGLAIPRVAEQEARE